MVNPHESFEVIRPDEVAECWSGVLSAGLYEPLWQLVQHYQDIDKEDNGPHDVIGINSVTSFWSHFDDAQRAKLNELAERNSW